MTDELNRPLGLDRKPPPTRSATRWLGAVLSLVALVGGAALWRFSGGPGGEPEAVAPIQPLAAAPPSSVPVKAPPPAEPAKAQQGEEENGVRVYRGGGAPPNSVIIQVPDQFTAPLAPAPDRRLVEKSRYGLLPHRGKDGSTPAQVYARPLSLSPSLKPGAPRIAIIVGGMGLNTQATDDAISRLPGAVALAFAPYGEQVEHQATSAREAGHEILLQAPMESFNPADAPGPHVLQAGDGARLTEDLHWQMARFSGYIGLVNFLGGKFTADRAATEAFLAELSERGLDYLDDGSSPQSLAADIAGEKQVDFVRADVRLDEAKKPEAVDAALFKLESLAREKGTAVGFAAGLPGVPERIARFAGDLNRRGIALVPVSAVLADRKTRR